MPRKLLPEKLSVAAAIDYPGAEILVSFPDEWRLVERLQQSDRWNYLAGFSPSYEKPRSNHFTGLSSEITVH